MAPRTHCLKGHLLSPDNVYTNKGKRHCLTCRKNPDKIRGVRALAKAATFRVCIDCKINKPLTDFYKRGGGRPDWQTGSACKECIRIRFNAWFATPEGKEKKGKQNARWVANNPERVRKNSKEYDLRIRMELLVAYGSCCECCGENEPCFLAIDHKKGNGSEHCKTIRAGKQMYLWLRKQGYPKDDYRLLCHSCNMSRGLYGYCPHELNTQKLFGFSGKEHEQQCVNKKL